MSGVTFSNFDFIVSCNKLNSRRRIKMPGGYVIANKTIKNVKCLNYNCMYKVLSSVNNDELLSLIV